MIHQTTTKKKDPITIDQAEISSLLGSLLANRGLTKPEEVERFLQPDYERHLNDPYLMKDMAKAVKRITRAVRKKERVIIYGDFDADGIPGTVALRDFFLEIGFSNFDVYIPHRHDEGFGVHLEAVEQFAEAGVDLLITVDCGVADRSEVARAVELGLDVIVTDHHEPTLTHPAKGRKPEVVKAGALAVLDPKRADCPYPDKNLCGAGVVFKLIQAMVASGQFSIKPGREKWFLDMVGLATLSDMVPLVGENRVLAFYGLKVLRLSRRPGLREMLRGLRISQARLTEDDIGFMIAPRINAASRMGVSMDAFNFLAVQDEASALEIVSHLNKVNDERKGVVAAMVKNIKARVTKQPEVLERKVMVFGDPEWRPSLLGLAAGSLATEYDRPVFLWGRDGRDVLKGSARSNGRVDLFKLMTEAGAVLESFGGHAQAGGFAVGPDKVHLLIDHLEEALSRIEEIKLQDKNEYDLDLSMSEVNGTIVAEVERLAPFGMNNPKPIFRFKEQVIERIKTFGKKGEHLELVFSDRSGRLVKAIGFFMAGRFDNLASGVSIDLLANMERSFFGGREEIRLRIVDISV